LEDLEEKRSIHSFHSLHSLRSSRSHPGPRPISEDLSNHHQRLRITMTTSDATHYRSPHSFAERTFKTKSQSFENVPLVSKQPSPVLAPINPAHKESPPKIPSQLDLKGVTETSI